MKHAGCCHCGAIRIELETSRAPQDHVLGACQCSFCRKHNTRAFSDPSAAVVITAENPHALQLYEFGLKTSKQVICNRCGVYVAMILIEGERVFSVLNIDTLDDRALFKRESRYPEAPLGGRHAAAKTRLNSNLTGETRVFGYTNVA
ncbi:hypothetical protein [uncultured Roseobacter sp.]|uniref:GFA family protein n=1 Tax=uncultured Roseobacter sp. TaxID=114847 RepID=UPI00260A880B|nr:hypothetical protein [uncultured Roseobacter sp.]